MFSTLEIIKKAQRAAQEALIPKGDVSEEDVTDDEASAEDKVVNTEKLFWSDISSVSSCSSPAVSLDDIAEALKLMDESPIDEAPASTSTLNAVQSTSFDVEDNPSDIDMFEEGIGPNSSGRSMCGGETNVAMVGQNLKKKGRKQNKTVQRRPKRTQGKLFDFSDKSFSHGVEIPEDRGEFQVAQPENGRSPYQYFQRFFPPELIDLIVMQTNLYAFQENMKPLNVAAADIKAFLGIHLLMGIIRLPSYVDYWSRTYRVAQVADVMSLKTYQKIRRFIHFSDNSIDSDDRYQKIRPVLDLVRRNCLRTEPEKEYSIDEMMVPYKGTKAGSRRQYVKNKPKKWGYKIFVRSGVSGMVYDFIPYGGEDTFRQYPDIQGPGFGAKIVLALSSSIENPALNTLYFDNYFTSCWVLHKLRHEFGILALGTVRRDRTHGACATFSKKTERGKSEQIADNVKKVVVVKWRDNKDVLLASNYVGREPETECLRYCRKQKKKVPVKCPKIVKTYNQHMGGVDLSDMLIALYRTPMRSKRWYLVIFAQILDICVNNAWLLYRRDLQILGDGEKFIPLKNFRWHVAECLINIESKVNRRLSANTSSPGQSPRSRPEKTPNTTAAVALPPQDVRFDQIGHMPIFGSRGRCRHCHKGQTDMSCSKCNARLCLVKNRNCFFNFHNK